MSYIELKYYRSHTLEVREYGDTGWAIHIYPPSGAQAKAFSTVVRTTVLSKLGAVLCQARDAVDAMLAERVIHGASPGA